MGFVVFILVIAVVALALRVQSHEASIELLRAQVALFDSRPTTSTPQPAPVPGAASATLATTRPAHLDEPLPPPFWAKQAEPPPAPPRERSHFEAVVAEHALAIVGGLFVLVAAIFFVTYAIDQGWIGPWLRVALAAGFGAALGGTGVWMGERMPLEQRRGRAIGSLHGVLAGVGCAIVTLAIVVGVRVEAVLDPVIAVATQALVSAATVQIARRWRSQDLAAFGIVVALAAPMLVDATADGAIVAVLFVALIASAVVAIAERWPRLLVVAAIVTTPQLLAYAATEAPSHATVLAAIGAWWALLACAAIACAIRDSGVPRSAVATMLATPLVVAGGVEAELNRAVHAFESVAHARAAPLAVFALVQLLLALGSWARWRHRIEAAAIALAGAGAATLAVAFGSALDGSAVTWAWAAEAVALWALWCRTRDVVTAIFAAALAIATLTTAVGAAYWRDSPLHEQVSALAAIGTALIAARWIAARLIERGEPERGWWCRAFDLGAAIAAWLLVANCLAWNRSDTTVSLLIGLWAASGAAMGATAAALTRRTELWVAWIVALVVSAAAFGYLHADDGWLPVTTSVLAMLAIVLRQVAPHSAEPSDGPAASLMQLGVFGSMLGAGGYLLFAPPSLLRAWHPMNGSDSEVLGVGVLVVAAATLVAFRQRRMLLLASFAGWYVASLAIVMTFTPPDAGDAAVQRAQVALTLGWVAIGVAALFAGTSAKLRSHHELRIDAYVLLGVAAAKLVLVDTIDFETPARVATFLVAGLGLLGSSALERRMRQ